MFSFRLQKVLDYRSQQEEQAKHKYLDAKATRIQGEAVLVQIANNRGRVIEQSVSSLVEHVELQARLMKFDDDEAFAKSTLKFLQDDEEEAEMFWLARRQELESLVKLREKAEVEWRYEQGRIEQAELDEWSVLRRAA